MGESLCIMPAFSYTSGISHEANQGNPMHALGESVSFGRFTSESLAWEKWSAFSQKRHVEEAERLARQGSVAEKKAFFEAHCKRIAAKKAAALLEQANAAGNDSGSKLESGDCNYTTHDSETMGLEDSQVAAEKQQLNYTTHDSETMELEDSQVAAEKQQELNVNSAELIINAKPIELEIDKLAEAELVAEPEVLQEIPTNVEALKQFENIKGLNMVSGLVSAETPQIKKPLLKNCISNQDVSRSASKKRPVLSSLRSTVLSKVTFSPAKSIATLQPRKENNFTPRTMKSTMDSTDKKKSTPKSLSKLMNFTPAREPGKLSTPAVKKIESSRIAPSSYKTSKDCTTPLRTPITASVNGVPRYRSITPCPENRSSSKSLSACQKKLQSSTLSTPFILRTELRAAKRKQKLEERFNEKDEQKVQMQIKVKENADAEVRKLRQTLCFRARPLPEFNRERDTSKNQIKKIPEMHPQSPKLGGKPNPSKIQDTNPLTKSSTKKDVFKNVLKKNSQTPARCLTSLQARTSN